MQITERANDSCRFWGYELALNMNLHNASVPYKERAALRAKIKEARATVKAAGLKSGNMGYRFYIDAVSQAERVERLTGIECHVFKHDYL